jgi:hypothetical protein
VVAVRVAQLAAKNNGKRLNGRQAWPLLWASSKRVSAGVIAWAALSALVPPLVVTALGFVVVMWLAVRRVLLTSVVRQATDLRGQTTAMRPTTAPVTSALSTASRSAA